MATGIIRFGLNRSSPLATVIYLRLLSTCMPDSFGSTATAMYTNCTQISRDPNTNQPTQITTVNGTLSQRFSDLSVCQTGAVPPGTSYTVTADHFESLTTDPNGIPQVRVAANLSQVFVASGLGCDGSNGTSTYEGTIDLMDNASGTNASYGYHGLQLAVQSGGVPCIKQTTATGSLDVNGRLSGANFSMTLPTVVITEGAGVNFTADGDVQVACLGSLAADTLRTLQFPFASCSGSVVPDYPSLPAVGADGFIVGSTFTAGIDLGAGFIPGGTSIAVSRLSFDLNCSKESAPGTCVDAGSVLSYVGDGSIVNDCVSEGNPVTFSSNVPAGGIVPNNHLVFTASPALIIPANSASACFLQFALKIEQSQTRDSTPLVIEQRAGLESAMCDNGGFSRNTADFSVSPEGVALCQALLDLSYLTHPTPNTIGSTDTVHLDFGTGGISSGTQLAISTVSVDLNCSADSAPGTCVDAGNALSYVGDSSIVNDCVVSGIGVTFSSNVPGGGTVPNDHLVFTASPPIVIPTQIPNLCFLEFGVRVDSQSNDSTPLFIEQRANYVGQCDNGLSATAGAVGGIAIDSPQTPPTSSASVLPPSRAQLSVNGVNPIGAMRELRAAAAQSQDCPLGGLIALTPPDSGTSQVEFMVDGSVQLMFADGSVKTIPSCKDLAVAQCSTPTATPPSATPTPSPVP